MHGIARRAGAAVVAAALVGLALIPANGSAKAGDSSRVRQTLYGLHMDLTYQGHASARQEAIGAAGQVGTEISRNSFLWRHIEPERDKRDWSRVDAVLAELDTAGIENVFTIYGSPTWANGHSDTYYVPTDPSRFQEWVERYATFMRAAAARYPGQRWEIGNEQNEHFFWKPGPDLDQYITWYNALYRAIREADPTAQIAVGGLAGLNTGCCISGRDFLRGLIDAGVPIDYVAVHPYASQERSPTAHDPWKDNFNDVEMIRNLLLSRGLDVPLWVTEWGWSSRTVGEQQQATYVRQSLEAIRDNYPYVEIATYFVDFDRPPEYYQGLFDHNFRPKAAAEAFASFMDKLARPAVGGGDRTVPDRDGDRRGEESAGDGVPLTRVAGPDRYGTAASMASEFPGRWQRIYVATGADFADALAAGPAASRRGGPVLLVTRDQAPAASRAALQQLRPAEIAVTGGTASVAEAVVGTLQAHGDVRRLAGRDRFATAAAVAEEAFSGPVPVAYVASGEDFPDALAAGAAAGIAGGPVLLAAGDHLPEATAGALAALEPERIVVVGGWSVVDEGVMAALRSHTDGPVTRTFGQNRYSTAAAVAQEAFSGPVPVVYLASGENFPDALAAGPGAIRDGGPLLLVGSEELPPATASALAALKPERIVVVGGSKAVSHEVAAAARAAAQQD